MKRDMDLVLILEIDIKDNGFIRLFLFVFPTISSRTRQWIHRIELQESLKYPLDSLSVGVDWRCRKSNPGPGRL